MDNFQLLGVSALLIATKYEEIWPIEVKELIIMSDNSCSKEKILQMEQDILTELDFNIDFVSSHSLLNRFVQISKVDKLTSDLAEYLLELTLLDATCVHTEPAYIALATLYLARRVLKHQNPWNTEIEHITKLSESKVQVLAKYLSYLATE